MKRAWLTIFLLTPIVLVAVTIFAALIAVERGGITKQTPVGAGAGETGGANAIGEYLSSRVQKEAVEQRALIESRIDDNAERYDHEVQNEVGNELAEEDSGDQPLFAAPESLDQGFILIVKDENDQASAERPIYLASNHNGWNPGDPNQRLEPRSDMRWQIVMPKPTSDEPLQFKFTLGSWESVERSADDENIENRTLESVEVTVLAPGEKPVIELTVPRFADAPENTTLTTARRLDPYRELDVTGTVRRIQVSGGAGGAAGLVRDALVWLPPGYDQPENCDRRYPVLYLMDGQNVFEKLSWVPGEWRGDESADVLIRNGKIEPVIIVGVPHAERHRAEEYQPFPINSDVEGDGERFVSWLRHEVIPRVERTFRVETGAESTGIGGSSYGGTIALYAATQHPDVFGLLIAESLPLGYEPDVWRSYFDSVERWPVRVFLGMGGEEWGREASADERNALHVREAEALLERLRDAGLGDDQAKLWIDPDAVHNEDAWAKRLPEALMLLFPNEG